MGGHQKLLPVELTAAAVVGQIQNQVGTTGALEVERLQCRGIGSIVGGEAVDFKVSSRPARKEKRGQVGVSLPEPGMEDSASVPLAACSRARSFRYLV
mgnify:CR=1 FL=1